MAGTTKSSEGFSKDELKFIKSPPEEIEIECRICLLVMLDDPHLVTCCGHHFCKCCIERVKIANKPCPLCKEQIQNVPDKGRHRIINGLRVYCTNWGEGCQWKGDLRDLPAHLNRGKRKGECQYEKVIIACKFTCKCQKKVQRRNLKIHEKQECTQRPYKCKFCGHRGSYKMITQQHYNECIKCPIYCPNCQLILDRHKVDYHMSNECLLRLVDCEFKWAGCQQRLPHKHIHQHNIDSHEDHMLLSINFYKKERDMFQEKNQMLKDENHQLNLEVKNIKEELQTKQKLYLKSFFKGVEEIQKNSTKEAIRKAEETAKRNAEETTRRNLEEMVKRIAKFVIAARRSNASGIITRRNAGTTDTCSYICTAVCCCFMIILMIVFLITIISTH